MTFPIQPGTTVLGRFEIVRCLGSGTVGTVYQCYNKNKPSETLALKVLASRIAQNEAVITRFRNEIHASYRVSHPNVVRAREFFHTADNFAFTMEFIEGASLAEILEKKKRLGIGEVISILRQLLAGIKAIHSAGMVHRDLKPQNIIISSSGIVKITDFSAAKFTVPPTGNADNTVIGTVDYMSPESLQYGTTNQQSDIYALGVLAYEMLTGEVPFRGLNLLDEVNLKLKGKAPAPHVRRVDCPQELSKFVMTSIAAAPHKRFPNIDAALMALNVATHPSAAIQQPAAGFGTGATMFAAEVIRRLPTLSGPTALGLVLCMLFMPLVAISTPLLRARQIDDSLPTKSVPPVTVRMYDEATAPAIKGPSSRPLSAQLKGGKKVQSTPAKKRDAR